MGTIDDHAVFLSEELNLAAWPQLETGNYRTTTCNGDG